MTTLAHFDCSTLDGLTLIETVGDVSSAGGIITVSGGDGNFEVLGFATTDPSTASTPVGMVAYAQVRCDIGGDAECWMRLVQAAVIGSNIGKWITFGGYGAFHCFRWFGAPLVNHTPWASSLTPANTFLANTWYDFKIEVLDADGLIGLYKRATPGGVNGNFDPDAAAWDTCSEVMYSLETNIVGEPLHTSFTLVTAAATFDIDEIYLTDDGVIGDPPSGGCGGMHASHPLLYRRLRRRAA